MAIVTLYSALNMNTAEFWDGRVVSTTSTEIKISDGPLKSVITGVGFEYDFTGITAGTINAFEQTSKGSLEYTFTELNTEATDAFEFHNNDDPQGLLALALNGDDTITGSAHADVLRGFEGADVVDGGDGNDLIHGDDKVGDDPLDGISSGVFGNDTLNGGRGNDEIHGDSGNDFLVGNRGNDTLFGGADNDTLIGSGGNDDLWGGAGGDLFIFAVAASGETDTINDYDRATGDRIRLAGDVVEYEIDDDGVDTTITYGNGNVLKVLDTLEGDIVFG